MSHHPHWTSESALDMSATVEASLAKSVVNADGSSQLSVCATSSGVVVIADVTPAMVLCQCAPLSEAAMTSLFTTGIVTHSAVEW